MNAYKIFLTLGTVLFLIIFIFYEISEKIGMILTIIFVAILFFLSLSPQIDSG